MGYSQRLASCLRHSARIGPDLLCHCHPLDWIVGPYYSLGLVHFEGKYSWLFGGLNSGALGDSFPTQGGAGRQVRREMSIIYR